MPKKPIQMTNIKNLKKIDSFELLSNIFVKSNTKYIL